MKSKILIAVLIILSVLMYTLAVINFTQWNALHGIEDVILAVTIGAVAWLTYRQAKTHRLALLTAKELLDLLKTLEKGVRATLTINPKDGQATVRVNDDEDEDVANQPEEYNPDQEPEQEQGE